MHHVLLFVLSYAHVAGYFNAEINNQHFYSIKLVFKICPTLQDGRLKPTGPCDILSHSFSSL